MAKYCFTVVFERELSHEEINELEFALSAQCEDYGAYVSQLIHVEPKKEPEKDSTS